MKISVVDTPRCKLGEGPVWDVADQALYWIDIMDSRVLRHDPATGETRSWTTLARPSALALRAGGGAVVAADTSILALDFGSGKTTSLATLDTWHPRQRFNDGKVDRRGRFVLGLSDSSMDDTQPIGGLYTFLPDHAFVELDRDVRFSNSPCFSPDGRTLYFSDSYERATYAYDYDLDTGLVANKRPFVNTRDLGGLPDGATVDRDGLVWIAIFEAGKVAAYRPDGGLERTVDLPVSLVASVAFGGPDLDRLYVVTIDPTVFGRAAEAEAGSTYVIDGLGSRGLAEPRYAG